MKKTNYAKISDKYEKNQFRKDELTFDETLRDYIQSNEKDQYVVLDLSCGTGLYLDKQTKLFDDVSTGTD